MYCVIDRVRGLLLAAMVLLLSSSGDTYRVSFAWPRDKVDESRAVIDRHVRLSLRSLVLMLFSAGSRAPKLKERCFTDRQGCAPNGVHLCASTYCGWCPVNVVLASGG